MEEWAFVDERELQGWKGGCVCITCQHFTYGLDQHCHTLLGCNLRRQQLQQGEHLTRKCRLWAPTWQKEMGWAPEAGQLVIVLEQLKLSIEESHNTNDGNAKCCN